MHFRRVMAEAHIEVQMSMGIVMRLWRLTMIMITTWTIIVVLLVWLTLWVFLILHSPVLEPYFYLKRFNILVFWNVFVRKKHLLVFQLSLNFWQVPNVFVWKHRHCRGILSPIPRFGTLNMAYAFSSLSLDRSIQEDLLVYMIQHLPHLSIN